MGLGLTNNGSNLWPGGVIPFEVDDTTFPDGSFARKRIVDAINAWNNASVIRLVPRTTETDFARFQKGLGCNTPLGRSVTGGVRVISCVLTGSAGNFMHEIGHCIGLIHEHQRPDRGQFVNFISANLQPPSASVPNPVQNFVIDSTNCSLGRYDCGSIMHYGTTAFGKVVGGVKQQTLTIQSGVTGICPTIGQRTAPSRRDIATVRALYEEVSGLRSKVTLGETSDHSPAVAADRAGRIFLAWKGAGNENLNLMFSTDGGFTFTGKHISNETSDDAPALLGGLEAEGEIFIGWRGSGSKNLNFAQVDRSFGVISGLINKIVLPETSDHRPALAMHDGRVCLAWTGEGNGKLNVIFHDLQKLTAPFNDKHTFDETSSHAPALASHDGQLFISWKGSGNENLNTARVDLSGTTVTGLSNKVTVTDTSHFSPSIVSQEGLLFMGFAGEGDGFLNLRFPADAGSNCDQKRVIESDSSDDAPALGLVPLGLGRGDLLVAWRGSGNENLNIARVAFANRISPPVIKALGLFGAPQEGIRLEK